MAVHVAVKHRTTYHFDRPVHLGPHEITTAPGAHSRTRIEAYSLTVTPAEHFVNWQQDPFGNHLARLVFPERDRADVTVDLVADLTVINPFDFFVEEYAEKFPFRYEPALAADLEPYLPPIVEPGGATASARSCATGSADRVPALDADGEWTVVVSSSSSTSACSTSSPTRSGWSPASRPRTRRSNCGIGSCRDSAWLLVSALRELGLAARFVSGYLVQLARDDRLADGPALPKDFTDLHAWAEVYLPGAGWVGLDPTSGLFAGEGHIPLSATPPRRRRRRSPAPSDPCETHDGVRQRGPPDPRGPPRHAALHRRAVGADRRARATPSTTRLDAGDVRLTMGGEPTFVSATTWSRRVEHRGRRRREARPGRRAGRPADRRTSRPAASCTTARASGTRASRCRAGRSAITWRTDGAPLWRDPALLADPCGRRSTRDAPADAGAAGRARSPRRSGIRPSLRHAGVRGRARSAWPTRRACPTASRPSSTPTRRGSHAATRAPPSIAELDADRRDPSGWVLPLHRAPTATGVGDGALAVPARAARPHPRRLADRAAPAAGLDRPGRRRRRDRAPTARRSEPPARLPRDAAEPRRRSTPVDGRADHRAVRRGARRAPVRLPAAARRASTHAVELLAAIEAAAPRSASRSCSRATRRPATRACTHARGHPRPGRDRGQRPARRRRGRELVEITDDPATRRPTRSAWRPRSSTSTAPTPAPAAAATSPSAARPRPTARCCAGPTCCVSLLTFWQHHPSLSYLFSGRFIGPTSQAPRVDEARHDSLYELEIAFAELDRLGDATAGAAVARSTGCCATCSPTSPATPTAPSSASTSCSAPTPSAAGSGCSSCAAFEMPPHPQMALVQALLVRALVARFWAEPYRGAAGPLGHRPARPVPAAARSSPPTSPTCVDDLRAHGFAFEPAWLEPFLEFRFPALGPVDVGPVTPRAARRRSSRGTCSARRRPAAAPPATSTPRSSGCRSRSTGTTAGRHVVTCNGVPVPLHAVSPTSAGGSVGDWWPEFGSRPGRQSPAPA